MTEQTNQKSIAIALDLAAGRAEMVNAVGATSKQCWFLAALIAKSGRDASTIGCQISNFNAVLTKRAASNYITDYLARAAS